MRKRPPSSANSPLGQGPGHPSQVHGRGPAASAAAAPDSIAYEARARAQASARVLGGLASDSGTDQARLAAFIRNYLLEAERR